MKMSMMTTLLIGAAIVPLVGNSNYNRPQFERYLAGSVPYCASSDEPSKPRRFRDALADSKDFFAESGWSTNRFIEELMFVMTNNVQDVNWSNDTKRAAAGVAAWWLREINRPAITNFFRNFNNEDNTSRLKRETIPGMFYYTNLEPEVFDYLRTVCVRTNIYENAAFLVSTGLHETLDTMSSELKPTATNRVAKYIYFSLFHVTRQMMWEDRKLADFIPAYSNSLQRLELMRHISMTSTNAWQRTHAQIELNRLSAIPTNQLNDISWIAEDL